MSEYIHSLVAGGSWVAFPVALLAGLVAGVNPCCLPIYPAAAGCCSALRRETLRSNIAVAAGFVLGGSLVMTVLGILTGLGGRLFIGVGPVGTYVIAAVVILAGLHLLRVIRLPIPSTSGRNIAARGMVGAVAAGALFGLVITPCSTPVLAGLLAYVATTGDPLSGGLLLFLYGLGLGIPVMLIGTAAASFVERLSTATARRWADALSGTALVGVGLYLVWIA